jgi:hypothetical protein
MQTTQWLDARNALANGTPYPPSKKPDGSWNYPLSIRRGWMHPGYGTEGGETSGTGITFGGPVGALATGNPDALKHMMAEQHFRLSRDYCLIIGPRGEPATWEHYTVNDAPIGGWRMTIDDPGLFDKSGGTVLDGPFGYSTFPVPSDPDLQALLAFQCTDWAHLPRSLFWHSSLALVVNDPVSRYLVRCYGELARMAWFCGGRSNIDLMWAGNGLGVDRDRILGWQLWAMNLAYAWGGNALRQRWQNGIGRARAIFTRATAGHPTICSIRGGKQATRAPYNGSYGVCVQPTGECQLAVGFGSLPEPGYFRERVFDKAASSIEWLRKGSDVCWSAATYNTSSLTPFPMRDDNLSSATWPSAGYDMAQALGVLGLAGFAGVGVMPTVVALLGPAPLAKMKSWGALACDSDAPLLAYLQSINSD